MWSVFDRALQTATFAFTFEPSEIGLFDILHAYESNKTYSDVTNFFAKCPLTVTFTIKTAFFSLMPPGPFMCYKNINIAPSFFYISYT